MKLSKLSTKWRVVVDTNIFVSAFIWGGNPKKIVKRWLKGKFILLLSPFLLSEIVLRLRRFGFTPDDLRKLRHILETNSLKFRPKRKTNLCRDKKDNQILDLCLVGRADYLVTGDKDLLAIKKFRSTEIVSARKFLTKHPG